MMKILESKKGAGAEDTSYNVALIIASVAILGILFSKAWLSYFGKPIGIYLQIFMMLLLTIIIIVGFARKRAGTEFAWMDYVIPFVLVVVIYYGLFMLFPKVIPQAFDTQSIMNIKAVTEQSLVSFFG